MPIEKRFLFLPHSMFRAALIGGWNTASGFIFMNMLVWATGITRGLMIIGFSWIIFCVVLAQSFFWNRKWVFSHSQTRVQGFWVFGTFALVAIFAGVVGSVVLHVVVNVIGAPKWIDPRLWVNVGVLCSIPFTFCTGYFGNARFVFKTL